MIIAARYKNLAKAWHPDRVGGDHEKFIQVSNCYGILMAQFNDDLDTDDLDTILAKGISDDLLALEI